MSTDKRNKDEELLINGVESEPNEDNRSGEEEREKREGREVFSETQELNAMVSMIKASLSEECPNLPDKNSFLKEVFEKANDKIPVETDDEEARKSLQLGDTCDKMIGGHPVARSVGDEDETLISICRMIHSSFAEPRLGEIKKRAILKEVFSLRKQIETSHEKPQPPQKTPAEKSTLFGSLDTKAWLLGAAALAAGLAALVFTWSLRRFDDQSVHNGRPLNRKERSQKRIARMIPGPFPAEQTFTHRMELLYGERLQANREALIRVNSKEAHRTISSLPADSSGIEAVASGIEAVSRLNEQYSVCAADIGRSPK